MIPSSRSDIQMPTPSESTATSSVALTGTRRDSEMRARKDGSWRSRAIAYSSREVAAWAASALAIPHAIAVATAVSTLSQCPPATSAAS